MIDPRSSLRAVPGIGPRRAAALAGLGFETVDDLLLRLPFRYEDRRSFSPLGSLREGEKASFRAIVRSPRLIRMRGQRFSIFEALLEDASAARPAVWYNQPYLAKTLVEGRSAFFFGELRRSRSRPGVVRFENPQFETLDPGEADPIHTGRIVPVYEKLGSLSSKAMRRLIHDALDSSPAESPAGTDGGEFLPAELRERLGLLARGEALRQVHSPPPHLPLDTLNRWRSEAHRRLIFEEFFLLQLALAMRRKGVRRTQRGFTYETGVAARRKLRGLLPFPLTEGQKNVLREIAADLESAHPMNRLLHGEVGSGKTIVATLAIALAADSGVQSAMMAPTEVLAEQHARSLRERLEPAGLRVDLLTSGVRGAERRRMLDSLRSGETQVAVGTHALIERGVAFRRLGLVVVDEQHRFGVLQRARLREKGFLPDMLVMTATPIPRTLALTVYGDLDVSVLEERPPGRSPVRTFVRGEDDRPALYDWILGEIDRGRQALVIYPLVEEGEASGIRAAAAMARRLSAEAFAGRAVGLVHGRMKPAEKREAMDRFRQGQTSVLVATTVVEVGIDVPNATILVVEHAERFGLSQLHQLRGRIGRGALRGTCVLMVGKDLTASARSRLAAIESEESGFKLAEIDLELRGPGELLGSRQWGMPGLQVGNLVRDRQILEEARREAFALAELEEEAVRLGARIGRLRPAWRERLSSAPVG